MTHEHSAADSSLDAGGEQTLYGEPCHEANGDCDEQSLYGEPQHDSANGTDAWDLGLLLAHADNTPTAPDELGSRTNASAAESADR